MLRHGRGQEQQRGQQHNWTEGQRVPADGQLVLHHLHQRPDGGVSVRGIQVQLCQHAEDLRGLHDIIHSDSDENFTINHFSILINLDKGLKVFYISSHSGLISFTQYIVFQETRR